MNCPELIISCFRSSVRYARILRMNKTYVRLDLSTWMRTLPARLRGRSVRSALRPRTSRMLKAPFFTRVPNILFSNRFFHISKTFLIEPYSVHANAKRACCKISFLFPSSFSFPPSTEYLKTAFLCLLHKLDTLFCTQCSCEDN